MASSLTNDQIVGIVLIVLAVLIFIGPLAGLLVALAAIALLVYGILALAGKVGAKTWVGVLCIVLGVLLLGPRIPYISDALGAITGIAVIIIGVLVLVLGILKVAKKA